MIIKCASLFFALVFATSGGAAAAPFSHLGGLSDAGSLTQAVRRGHYKHHGHGYWHSCPYYYEQNLLGQWRLYSPCSNRVATHAF